MIVPALINLSFNVGREGEHGWGIPMATDIAFAVRILSLVGNRVPLSLIESIMRVRTGETGDVAV